jgi:AcrR family transcriptional regulator
LPTAHKAEKAGVRGDQPSGARTVKRRNLAVTRSALLDAASDVFAKRGYANASLEEIAAAAGFTRGAVHHHFSSKEEILLAVVTRRDQELLAGYEPDLSAGLPSDPPASAARWQKEHGDSESEVALRLELRSHAIRSPAVRRQLVSVQQAAVEATSAKLAKIAAEQGITWRFPVEYVAELLHAASHAAAERSVLTGESGEDRMAAFTELILKGALETPTGKG